MLNIRKQEKIIEMKERNYWTKNKNIKKLQKNSSGKFSVIYMVTVGNIVATLCSQVIGRIWWSVWLIAFHATLAEFILGWKSISNYFTLSSTPVDLKHTLFKAKKLRKKNLEAEIPDQKSLEKANYQKRYQLETSFN